MKAKVDIRGMEANISVISDPHDNIVSCGNIVWEQRLNDIVGAVSRL